MQKKITFQTSQTITLNDFLRNALPLHLKNELKLDSTLSNSKIRRLILSGCVKINGKQIQRPAFELRGKSVVTIDFDSDKFFFEKQPDDIKYEVSDKDVLYETQDLIFINKPAFFPVEQTITGNRDNLHDSTVNYLWKKNPELRNPPYVGIMHRLDKDTSGVILFTKNRTVNKTVSQMFSEHDFTKEYLAVCEVKPGFSLSQTFTVEKFMGRVTGLSKAGKWGTVPQSKGGVYSKTDFQILSETTIEGKKCFVIKCLLFTGRTHQIRVHLSEAGIPILGDELYGGKPAKRMYLHASKLAFNNQLGNIEVSAPIPW